MIRVACDYACGRAHLSIWLAFTLRPGKCQMPVTIDAGTVPAVIGLIVHNTIDSDDDSITGTIFSPHSMDHQARLQLTMNMQSIHGHTHSDHPCNILHTQCNTDHFPGRRTAPNRHAMPACYAVPGTNG